MDYEDQLNKALDEVPDVVDGEGRFRVPSPDVRPEGNATVYENFDETCDRLARDPTHLTKALQSELGTSAQIDEKGRLRLTGDFDERRVQSALDDYVADFVRCSECDSPDTRLETDQGATVMKCDACGALSAVPDL
ncbi:translation initiation factor IF-2 subunit beta [Halogeometricum limi]|uniref:Translation initiation factor 2 subunit beta n=1 Tax=Halogeometricum limi TaxID=555875 RepID=A0A1I6IR14_9EURY|nr:translation initiation factor IF-2 subunit beta [Halogeometricum limi]SFR69205.1 translation initiation factor 2 subunit 2 [Halogeometricum limi]